MSEATLQNTFYQMFTAFYPKYLFCLSLSGISLNGTPTERALVMKSAKSAGLANGLPDVQLALPNAVTLNLEFKKPSGGIQSADQKHIESVLHSLGHTYYLVNSIDLAFQLIAEHTQHADRLSAYYQLTNQLPPVLSEQFLYFPAGTPKPTVLSAVEPYFHL